MPRKLTILSLMLVSLVFCGLAQVDKPKGTDEPSPSKPTGQAAGAKASGSDASKTNELPNEYKGEVDLLIGLGSQVVSPSATNYHIVNNAVIQEVNLGAATPQIMTGLGFRLPFPMRHDAKYPWLTYPWHAFMSLKFTPGSENAVDGYVVGLTFRIAKYLDLLAGYSVTPLQEISPGFQAAAVQAVEADPADYSTFAPTLSKLETNAKHAFDGFPLQKQGSGQQGNLFSGNPLTTHYRNAAIIGISFPINLGGVFGSQKTGN